MRSLVCMALLAALVAGCKGFASSTDPVAREQEIIRDVKVRLAKDPRFDEVLVAVQGRIVTLSGRVTAPLASKEAQDIAAGVRDVERVQNRIEVKPK